MPKCLLPALPVCLFANFNLVALAHPNRVCLRHANNTIIKLWNMNFTLDHTCVEGDCVVYGNVGHFFIHRLRYVVATVRWQIQPRNEKNRKWKIIFADGNGTLRAVCNLNSNFKLAALIIKKKLNECRVDGSPCARASCRYKSNPRMLKLPRSVDSATPVAVRTFRVPLVLYLSLFKGYNHHHLTSYTSHCRTLALSETEAFGMASKDPGFKPRPEV